MREFHAYTADLYRLADWLAECGIKTVAMESTGVYWIPAVFGVLEERGFEVILVDPRRMKNVPGRKTDVQGLPSGSSNSTPSDCFPAPSVPMERCAACGVTCGSDPCWWSTRPHHIQHMHKALTQMNVKFQHVIRAITGKTDWAIIEAIVSGERDPAESLPGCETPGSGADEATIARSLQGHWRVTSTSSS